ncbi:M28 family peptidase [Anaerosolibacter sp.]|uniref:M28 family peptidase n=1 Tax=Anaerosolibacter sp. TaxID=1872527 RepID=UPI0039F0579B
MKRKTKILALVLVFVLIMSSFALAAPKVEKGSSAVAFDKKVLARIDADKVLKHISYLSETIGPRIAGSEEEREAAEYIKDEFEKYGYDTKMQEFPFYSIADAYLSVDGTELEFEVPDLSGGTDADGVTAEVVDCGLGNSLDEFLKDPVTDEYLVKGKIALIQRGVETFVTKAENATAAGAIGVILYNRENIADPNEIVMPGLGTEPLELPFVSISLNDGRQIRESLADGEEVEATIMTEQIVKESQNVIAVKGAKNKGSKDIVYVTAHYDSVPGAPGANDNASGTAMMLEFARILKSYPVDKEVRFVACGAEEIGILGSDYYVMNLSDEDFENSFANFNMDMISTSAEECDILYADTVDGEPNIVTEAAEAAGARLGNNILSRLPGDRSDHAPFGYSGIPAACFIWGDENGDLEDWYHTPSDTIAINISLDRLQQAGEIIGSALYDVIRKDTANLTKSKLRRVGRDAGVYEFGVQE